MDTDQTWKIEDDRVYPTENTSLPSPNLLYALLDNHNLSHLERFRLN